jgi:GNAT superfamily N-acetyltransferase
VERRCTQRLHAAQDRRSTVCPESEVRNLMTDHVVRPARPDELAEVGALTADGYRVDGLLTRSAGTAQYEAELLDAAGRAAAAELLVAVEPGGRLLGTVTWCPPGSGLRELATRPDQGEFRMLAVTPAARRRGVARALVSHCLAEARRLGLAELVLSSLGERGGEAGLVADAVCGQVGQVGVEADGQHGGGRRPSGWCRVRRRCARAARPRGRGRR